MDKMLDTIGFVAQYDKEVGAAMSSELTRQCRNIELIASENIVSSSVLAAMGTVLTNKYAEGYPGRRYYGGCEYVDIVEEIAIERAKKLFGAEHANVQPHSGSQANFSVYTAFLEPGDTVLGMNLNNGGHLTHGSPVNLSGKLYNFVSYTTDDVTGTINYDEVRELAVKHKPKMIVAGASAYPRIIDFEKFGQIAGEVGAYLFVDIAHIAGQVAAGLHPSPFPHADFVTTTTHKTLRGPRGGIIFCKKEYAKQIDKSVFPGNQGGPLMNIIAAKAVCLGEALTDEFAQYQKQIVLNCAAFADELMKKGFDLVSGGTDNHLVLIDLRKLGITGKEFEKNLDKVYITTNKNSVPGDPLSPMVTSGIRAGTPAVTSRGFKEAEMRMVADWLWRTATNFEKEADNIRMEVEALAKKFPIYGIAEY